MFLICRKTSIFPGMVCIIKLPNLPPSEQMCMEKLYQLFCKPSNIFNVCNAMLSYTGQWQHISAVRIAN